MDERRMWHVTLTVGGEPAGADEVRLALQRLGAEQPFLVEGRYAGDRVEIDYWEEAEGCEDAAALALRLWGEHRTTAGLPAWSVLGLEVVERDVLASRRGRLRRRRPVAAVSVPTGEVRLRPLPG